VFSVRASDGKNTTTRTFTVRSVADLDANAPKILVSTTPSTPVLPGQAIVATVRADAFSGIANITVQMRSADTNGQWQTVALDSAGRLHLTASQSGLLELRVTATDRDGFTSTATHTILVKDPVDTQAPCWPGAGRSPAPRPWGNPSPSRTSPVCR